MLERAAVQTGVREVVVIGADRGPESVDSRRRAYEIDQLFARSLSLSDGLESAPLFAYALNGEPLTAGRGRRPGWTSWAGMGRPTSISSSSAVGWWTLETQPRLLVIPTAAPNRRKS